MITSPRAWKVAAVLLVAVFVGVIVFALTATSARAQQPQCGPHDEFLRLAAEQYGEIPAFVGLSDRKRLVEILVSPKGTFTIILVDPATNTACVADYGEGWQEAAQLRKGSF